MLEKFTQKIRGKKEYDHHAQTFAFVSSSEYYEKLRLIGLELFNRYIYSNDLQNEAMLAWGALFHLISGQLNVANDEREEIKSRIEKRLQYLLQIPEQLESNWELGFAASVYFYVLKKMGLNVDKPGDKIHSILNNVHFYRIPGVSKTPAFLGFTLAMFNEKCNDDDECKLYYFMYKKINKEEVEEVTNFNRNDLVESLLAYYLYGERSGLQLNELWIQLVREVMGKEVNEYIKKYEPYESECCDNEIFIPKERLFLLLILMKLLGLDKVIYVVGLSNEEEMKRILKLNEEIEKTNRRATIIFVSSLVSITILVIWGFVIPSISPSLFLTLLHSVIAIVIGTISYVLGVISLIIDFLRKVYNKTHVKNKVN
ncbi:hypothetical protein [Saccharolobus caldissimus]|uniref:Uncharacterized protein n=1 Tax=Saccharolobus caldissimus TaxID=1702097 RepID=A0AAQ4CNR9_9CREN|nr:hypothetical protein [Saccharolobus caldissimus]BDB97450.1 hypothetical protein SACC_04670 [Saccharolobus caldissimus]